MRTYSTRLALAVLVSGATAFAQAAAGQQPTREQKPAGQQQQPAGERDRTLGKTISDSWITMKIHSQFVPDDALENSDIDVDTLNGVVTLSGTVPTQAGKSRAIELARTTEGVKSVNDAKLRVAAEPAGTAGRAHTR